MERVSARGLPGNSGVISVTVLLAVPLIAAVILYVVGTARMFRDRSRLQELADASAAQAAAVQARGLNALAILNGAILTTEALAAGTFLGGHSAASALDALLLTLPEGIDLHIESNELTSQLRDAANDLAMLQDALVEALAWLPAGAAQLPLLLEPRLSGRTLVLPYPLPGISSGLTAAVPVGRRAAGFENFGRELSRRASRQMKGADEKAVRLTQGALGICKLTPAVLKKAIGSLRGVSRGTKARLTKQLVSGCRELTRKYGDSERLLAEIRSKVADLGPRETGGEETVGFPMPLPLLKGYARSYQVGVVTVGCRAENCTIRDARIGDAQVAVAQARAVSYSQNAGGDLLLPDFRARLVPVASVLEGFPLNEEIEDALWVVH